ncbi:MAG: prenyltransferase/squalene oxidase repeat-containing protein [Thermoguttaceae bacterium]|jgi:geranylgeranyl transferase type-2 subunit beta
MTSSVYLDALDELLRSGVADLSARFIATQVRYVAGCQQPDGGFAGRQGASDEYYTDFALRTLALLAPGHDAFRRAADYLVRWPGPPRDMVQCFTLLSATRSLEQSLPSPLAGEGQGVRGLGQDTELLSADPLWAIEWLYAHLLPSGGFARYTDDQRVSAYHTFLGALCFQMLGHDMPAIEDAISAVAALARADGGYAELAGQTASQTNATAAAVALLMMRDALPAERAAKTARFLARMQSGDGGLRSHDAARGGDLLSTFTGLLTLLGLGGLDQVDLAGVARFLKRAAHRDGGFLACFGDDCPDVEYTYYGVCTLALLRLWTSDQKK